MLSQRHAIIAVHFVFQVDGFSTEDETLLMNSPRRFLKYTKYGTCITVVWIHRKKKSKITFTNKVFINLLGPSHQTLFITPSYLNCWPTLKVVWNFICYDQTREKIRSFVNLVAISIPRFHVCLFSSFQFFESPLETVPLVGITWAGGTSEKANFAS